MAQELPPEIAALPDGDKIALMNMAFQLKRGIETGGGDGVHPANAEGYVRAHTEDKAQLRRVLD